MSRAGTLFRHRGAATNGQERRNNVTEIAKLPDEEWVVSRMGELRHEWDKIAVEDREQAMILRIVELEHEVKWTRKLLNESILE